MLPSEQHFHCVTLLTATQNDNHVQLNNSLLPAIYIQVTRQKAVRMANEVLSTRAKLVTNTA